MATFLKILKNKKLLFAVFIGIAIIAIPFFAHAQNKTQCGTTDVLCGVLAAFTWVILAISYGLGKLAAILISVAASFTDVIYSRNIGILNFAPGSLPEKVISQGFNYSRVVANIGFVFAIIFIAFATIFRIQSYGMKQMLWKLVVAAVLINFSLLIAGAVIDFSHVASNSFLQIAKTSIAKSQLRTNTPTQAQINDVDLSDGLGKLLNPQALLNNISPDWYKAEKAAASSEPLSMISLFVLASFTNLFLYTLAVVLFAIGIMLLARYIYLAILLVVMPLAWMFWVLPKYNHLSGNWWDRFFQQALYLPAVMFFLSLAMTIGGGIGSDTLTIGLASKSAFGPSGVSDSLVEIVINLLVVLGLLVGGLIAGQKLGGAGAGLAMSFSKKMKRYGTGGAGWLGKRAGMGTLSAGTMLATGIGRTAQSIARQTPVEDRVRVQGARESGRTIARAGETVMSKLQGVPVFGRIAKGLGATKATAKLGKLADTGKEQAEKYQKNVYDKMSDQAFENTVKSSVPASDVERVAMIKEAAKRGMVDDLRKKHGNDLVPFVRSVKGLGAEGEIKKMIPSLAPALSSKQERDEVKNDLAKELTGETVVSETILKQEPAGTHTGKARSEPVPGREDENLVRHIKNDGSATIVRQVRGEASRSPEDKEVDAELIRKAQSSMKTSDAKNLPASELSNPVVVANLNTQIISSIAGSGEQKKIDGIISSLSKLSQDFDKIEAERVWKTTSPDPTNPNKTIEHQMAVNNTQLKNLKNLVQYFKKNPGLTGGYYKESNEEKEGEKEKD